MNVALTAELEEFVSAKVKSGRYNSASEVLCEALRLMQRCDDMSATLLAEFSEVFRRRLGNTRKGVNPAEARRRHNRKADKRRKHA